MGLHKVLINPKKICKFIKNMHSLIKKEENFFPQNFPSMFSFQKKMGFFLCFLSFSKWGGGIDFIFCV